MDHNMKKTAVSFFLILCLVTCAMSTAMAAPDGARKTNFFPHDQYHTEQDFSDIEYRHIELEPILAEIENARGLLDDPANTAEVERMFWEITDKRIELATMKNLVEISMDRDVDDEKAAEEFSDCSAALVSLDDERKLLIRDILLSSCAGFLEELLDETQIEKYRNYEAMDKNLADLIVQEGRLVSEYMSTANEPLYCEYNGKIWTMGNLAPAYVSGEIGMEDIAAIQIGMYATQNRDLGEIYLKMVELRKQIAQAQNYDYYPEYAYKELYQRDYMPDDVSRLYADVKEYIVPIYTQLKEKNSENMAKNEDLFSNNYMGEDGEAVLDLIEPYIAQFSSEMLEAVTYMREHHFYDTTRSDSKYSSLYVSDLPFYGVPFFFKDPLDSVEDITGSVHELGHYNNFFYTPRNSKPVEILEECIDTQEVHSQGFELLFSHFYPEIFSEEDIGMVETFIHFAIIDGIVRGAMFDEFQQYAYSTDSLTLKQLNKKYYELCGEYGVSTQSQDGEGYSWVTVNHTFDQPCYYISYCTSAAGAYAFWIEAQSDYFGAADKYLQFVALDPALGFQKSFDAVGMSNPLSEGYLKELSEILYKTLDIESPAEASANPFSDVSSDSMFYDAIQWAVKNKIAYGSSDSTFSPDDPCTRSEIVTFLWRAMGQPAPASEENPFTDVDASSPYYEAILWAVENGITSGASATTYEPDAACTRAQAVTFLYRAENSLAGSGTNSFTDVASNAYYADAVQWAVNTGVTVGTSDTAFSPDQTCTRAQIVTFLYRDLAG